MKKLFIYFTLVCVLLLIIPACSPNGSPVLTPGQDDNYGGDPMDFTSFTLSERGMAAQSSVYEGYKTENGVHLEYYLSSIYWDETAKKDIEEREVVRAVDGNDALYREVCALFGNCRIDEWNGFSGANPPDILDGSSMSFEAVLADGTSVTAYGTNNFPANYSTFAKAIHNIITKQRLDSTEFSDGTYAVTLPQSWVGVVSAEFSDSYVSFSVSKTDGDELTFFIIDNIGYGYSSESYDGRIEAGRLVSGEDVRFITARDHYSISAYAEKVSSDALALWESYESDKLAIVESIRGVNGYEFYPEDGSILHDARAWDMAEEARHLWQRLYFAGEYSVGTKPTVVRFKKYVPMFPSYDYVDTIDSVRNRFLAVFSEEFTEKTLNRAIADRDIIEYKGSVYAAYRKTKSQGSSHSWMECVRDEGDGCFTVVIGVRTASGDTIYVDLPACRNEAGKFVFTDYPYWDKSE